MKMEQFVKQLVVEIWWIIDNGMGEVYIYK